MIKLLFALLLLVGCASNDIKKAQDISTKGMVYEEITLKNRAHLNVTTQYSAVFAEKKNNKWVPIEKSEGTSMHGEGVLPILDIYRSKGTYRIYYDKEENKKEIEKTITYYPYLHNNSFDTSITIDQGQIKSAFMIEGDKKEYYQIKGNSGLNLEFNITQELEEKVSGKIEIYDHTQRKLKSYSLTEKVKTYKVKDNETYYIAVSQVNNHKYNIVYGDKYK